MDACTRFAEDNIACLRQGLDLLNRIDDPHYTRSSAATYGSGIGGHIRHCVDHYANFLAGLAGGRIDYDARERDPRVEQDRRVAVVRIAGLIEELAALRGRPDAAVQVKMDCGNDCDPAGWWSGSTIRRELQFLISHTVHHYALIGFILKREGIDPGPGFGVAPSTLRYNATQPSCAR